MNKVFKLISIIITSVTLILEIYPKSVVISRIANPYEQSLSYSSYFSFLTEKNYTFYTGILTIILLIILILSLFKKINFSKISSLLVCIIASVFSYYSTIELYDRTIAYSIFVLLIIDSILLLIDFIINFIKTKKIN